MVSFLCHSPTQHTHPSCESFIQIPKEFLLLISTSFMQITRHLFESSPSLLQIIAGLMQISCGVDVNMTNIVLLSTVNGI